MAKEIVVTHEGLKKLEEELNNLRTVKRKEVADKIKVSPAATATCPRMPSTTPPRKSRRWSRPASPTWKLP